MEIQNIVAYLLIISTYKHLGFFNKQYSRCIESTTWQSEK